MSPTASCLHAVRCLHGAALVALIVIVLASCSSPDNPSQQAARSLDEIKTSGKLRVLTRNAPTTYYIGRDGEPAGPEHDMAQAFASALGVEVEFIVKPSVKSIVEGIDQAEADLAAAGLTVTADRKAQFAFGPAYLDVTQQVVCRRDNVQPETVEELAGLDVVVIAGSSYAHRLAELRKTHADLTWRETEAQSTEDLLYSVWKREIDCTVADSNIVDLNRRYFPELIAPLNLNRSESLAWMMPSGRDDLQGAVTDWFRKYRESGRLSALNDQYYGFFEVFDYVDIRKLIARIDKRFPRYQSYFRQAAEKYDIPFHLLAAQGYQESHWRANAKSPTGVRGIMMLTRNTAEAMGVDNRLDPKQSIFGGAKYLAKLKKNRFSDEIREPDLTWLALAAYNVGRAHLHDAQTLARQQGLSPYLWKDIKQVLPLLADKRYYKKLKYGYARGTEPVRYVQRIREYQHVIENELGK
ncbi:MAG: membrane-bound lytic murein transglycosylase MltF [Ketobacteraceae bacterium]|nr:membrane-bound lytic murein transglycosylase MltF [Ketobacteraceae bacterium]